MEFLSEVIFQPNVSESGFDQNVIENEKRALKQRIQSIYDDKMRYSNQRVIDVMCENEPYALSVYGEKDEVDSITPQSLYAYYIKALAEDQIDLYMVGDIKEEEIGAYIEDLFPFKERTAQSIDRRKTYETREVKEVREVQDIKQGKLNMGFRTNIVYGDPEYFALQVLNGIYGGFSHSKLFINVREKESLAYYAASRLESHKGLLLVMSGIDNNNYDKAVKIIKEQMELMKKANFPIKK